jgi:precorrin isomerase
MSAIPFDTYTFYDELVKSGLAEKTADALTKAVTKIEQAKIEELATKQDIRESELRLELKISETKAELVRWVIGAGFLQVALIAGLMLRLADKM